MNSKQKRDAYQQWFTGKQNLTKTHGKHEGNTQTNDKTRDTSEQWNNEPITTWQDHMTNRESHDKTQKHDNDMKRDKDKTKLWQIPPLWVALDTKTKEKKC